MRGILEKVDMHILRGIGAMRMEYRMMTKMRNRSIGQE
jgi:hypothetical protein